MDELTLIILFAALFLDWRFGEPEFLWSRFPHPVVLFGKAIGFADRKLNQEVDTDAQKYRKGALAISLLVLAALSVGLILEFVLGQLSVVGWLLECAIVFVLLAQKSLGDHVGAVAMGLREDGLKGGRAAVAMIIGRDPQTLEQTGIIRASIESLAENFSDGVVAPAFWYAIFGLPGILAYKMINTADSMIGYKNEKYLWFGCVAAQVDDFANWLPARLSALIVAVGNTNIDSLKTAFQDAGLHRSPNAGWPEAAFASVLGIALGGPRVYAHETVAQAYLNSSGRTNLKITDIDQALYVFAKSCFALWGLVLIVAVFA